MNFIPEQTKYGTETIRQIRTRTELPPLERAVSDTLDEYMHRLHGLVTSWAHPCEFIDWLEERGYIIHAKEGEVPTGVE